jgi:acyl-CoA synthetase (AMP-forming)/AMP-acid ligase II
MEGFLPELVLELIEKERITTIHAVPPIVLFLANSPLVDKYDTSSVTYVFSGGKGPDKAKEPEKLILRISCSARKRIDR